MQCDMGCTFASDAWAEPTTRGTATTSPLKNGNVPGFCSSSPIAFGDHLGQDKLIPTLRTDDAGG